MTAMPQDNREALLRFAVSVCPDITALQRLAGDAGTRVYYRADAQPPVIVADSSADIAQCRRFTERTAQFAACGLRVPQILAGSGQGWLVMEDFGQYPLQDWLEKKTAGRMQQPLALLADWQAKTAGLQDALPPYSVAVLREELSRLELWFFPHFLGHALSKAEAAAFAQDAQTLIDIIDRQPKCAVHRDFHSRNLMVLPEGGIGIIDYQDALWGACQYDLVSLTRDCYRRYPDALCREWEENFRTLHYPDISPSDWTAACHAVSLQRHLKVLGLFVRLSVEENKHGYMAHLPLVWRYAAAESRALQAVLPFTAAKLAALQPAVHAAFAAKGLL